MYLVEMVKKEGLISKPKPIRKAEEGGTDHYGTRAEREKGGAKEGAAGEPSMEAVKVMVGAKELLVRKVLLMAEGDKRPEVMVGAKELLVLEVVEMVKPLEPRVAKAPLKAWLCKAPTKPTKAATKSTHAAVESSMKAAKSSYAMGPGRCGEKPPGENDKPYDDAFLHGLALLSSLSSSACCPRK